MLSQFCSLVSQEAEQDTHGVIVPPATSHASALGQGSAPRQPVQVTSSWLGLGEHGGGYRSALQPREASLAGTQVAASLLLRGSLAPHFHPYGVLKHACLCPICLNGGA